MCQANTVIGLDIHPVYSEFLLLALRLANYTSLCFSIGQPGCLGNSDSLLDVQISLMISMSHDNNDSRFIRPANTGIVL